MLYARNTGMGCWLRAASIGRSSLPLELTSNVTASFLYRIRNFLEERHKRILVLRIRNLTHRQAQRDHVWALVLRQFVIINLVVRCRVDTATIYVMLLDEILLCGHRLSFNQQVIVNIAVS
jgi:hypothetical protein